MMNFQYSGNTKQHWLNHIKQWQDSGLSQTNYCKKHDLKPRNLSYTKRNKIMIRFVILYKLANHGFDVGK